MFDPPGVGKNLTVFFLNSLDDVTIGVENHRPGACCALVDSHDVLTHDSPSLAHIAVVALISLGCEKKFFEAHAVHI
jgi:hypothetical protein